MEKTVNVICLDFLPVIINIKEVFFFFVTSLFRTYLRLFVLTIC